jgi:O-antigen ligase
MAYASSARLYGDPDWISLYNQMNMMTVKWYKLLMQLGLSGCIIGILSLLKNIRESRQDNNTKQFFKDRIIAKFLLMMLFWGLISFIISGCNPTYIVGTDYRRDGILTYFIVAGLFSCGYLIRDKKYIKWIMELFTIVALIQSLLIIIDIDAINKQLGLTENSSVFFNINHSGYYLCMAVMCALLLYETDEASSRLKSLYRLAAFAIITAALVKNRSLGPYLAAVCAIISSLILAIWLNKGRLKKLIKAIMLFIVVTLIMNITEGRLYIDLKILGLDLFRMFEGEEDISDIGSGRWILWVRGVRFIGDSPIFGCGPGALMDLYDTVYGDPNRPHNEFIEYAACIGIPGVMYYIMALFIYLKDFVKKRKYVSTFGFALLSVVIAYLVSSLFGVTMYYTSPFFFMIFGLSVGLLQETPYEKTELKTKNMEF